MLDAYQDYQIPLTLGDQEKVSFITSDRISYYTMMPFGHKNSETTYQRLMDRVFNLQIGRNIKVYVDNILVKSTRVEDIIGDLDETFVILWKYSLKLNPSKCIFNVKSGWFHGYLVNEREIEANPEKARALQKMKAP